MIALLGLSIKITLWDAWRIQRLGLTAWRSVSVPRRNIIDKTAINVKNRCLDLARALYSSGMVTKDTLLLSLARVALPYSKLF